MENKHSSQGKPLPDIVRHRLSDFICKEEVIEALLQFLILASQQWEILSAITVKLEKKTGHFLRNVGGREGQKLDVETMKAIEPYKIAKPSIYAKEIRSKLVEDNVCAYQNLPCVRYITMGLHEIGYTYKKLTSVPTESQTPNCQARYDDFLSYISDMDAHSIHFFDESSVIKTTGKRKYGSCEVGKRAIEIQPYASNVTFTIKVQFACAKFTRVYNLHTCKYTPGMYMMLI